MNWNAMLPPGDTMLSMAEVRRPIPQAINHSRASRQRLCLIGSAVLLLVGLASALLVKYDQADSGRLRPSPVISPR